MAIQTVWSVDLGKSSLKAVKLRRDRNNVEIVAVDKVNYPLSANGSTADIPEHQREALEIFAARNAIKEPVAVSHPGQGTFSRFIKVPAFEAKKVDEMVGYEASQQIPFPLDEVIWDYHIVDREYLPGEEREVALFAVRREAIDDFLLEFASQDLAVETVSIGYLGLLNFVQHDLAPEEPAVVLDIGATHTDLVLVDGKRFWVRSLPHSGNEVTKAIAERFKLEWERAERLKLETARVPPQKAAQIFQAVIQPKLKDLVAEVHRSIGFYRSQHGETSFKQLHLLGNGSKIIGIKKFLEESLSMRVERVSTINHFRVAREVNLKLLQADLPAFGTSLGAGLQALGLGDCRVDLVPHEEKLAKEVGRKKKHVFIAAAIVLAAMVVAYFMSQVKFRQALATYQAATYTLKPLDESGEDISRFATDLKRYSGLMERVRKPLALRSLALRGFQAIDATLRDNFPNDRALVHVINKDDEGSYRLALQEFEAALFTRLWLPRVEVTKVYVQGTVGGVYTELEEKDYQKAIADLERKKASGDAGSGPEPKFSEGYKYRLFPTVKLQSNATDTANFVRDQFVNPLAERLKNDGLDAVPFRRDQTVQLETGFEVAEIGIDRQGRGTTMTKNPVTEQPGQEFGPYFTLPVSFVLVAELPLVEEPVDEDDPDEFGDSRESDADGGAN